MELMCHGVGSVVESFLLIHITHIFDFKLPVCVGGTIDINNMSAANIIGSHSGVIFEWDAYLWIWYL
jgi:hypothetical protein